MSIVEAWEWPMSFSSKPLNVLSYVYVVLDRAPTSNTITGHCSSLNPWCGMSWYEIQASTGSGRKHANMIAENSPLLFQTVSGRKRGNIELMMSNLADKSGNKTQGRKTIQDESSEYVCCVLKTMSSLNLHWADARQSDSYDEANAEWYTPRRYNPSSHNFPSVEDIVISILLEAEHFAHIRARV